MQGQEEKCCQTFRALTTLIFKKLELTVRTDRFNLSKMIISQKYEGTISKQNLGKKYQKTKGAFKLSIGN